MNDLVPITSVPPMSQDMVNKVRELESALHAHENLTLELDHVLHAGTYCRTLKIPAGVLITGAEIVIPTVLIVQGNCRVFFDGGDEHLIGYNVYAMSAPRKSVFIAYEDTYLTMVFATNAKTVEEAEKEFTCEPQLLLPGTEN